MPPPPSARLRDARAVAALGLAAGITVPAALLGGPQAAALPGTPPPIPLAVEAAGVGDAVEAVGAPERLGVAGASPSPLAAGAAEQPGCGRPDAKEFPIAARIQDAPGRYEAGGDHGTWVLDLTNTTDATCRALHPVLVLTDRDRRLTAEQIRAEFSEPGRTGATHHVTWETTDRDEQIGVFGGGVPEGKGGGEEGDRSGEPFLGFTVPAGETVSVRVRMAFTPDAAPGPVTAHAVVVQRRHQDKAKGGAREDGEWVGDSEEYPFVIADGATGGTREPEPLRTERPPRSDASPQRGERPESPPPQRSGQPESPSPQRSGRPESSLPERPDRPGSPEPDHSGPVTGTRTGPGTGRDAAPSAGPGARPPAGLRAEGREERPGHPPRDGFGRPLPELARTGPASAAWTGTAAGVLLLGGTGLLLYARRVRRTTG
ncbi:LPXTG cell wall anchor domain-containing protein [Streptomyces sp. NPDC018007]|uniref:LPXTG cell wall anchor domain-containing protein n=1 Tax=Streptomyces sp. NPDC018007 TaxID=3365029 RepID=UPI0037A157C8